MSNNLLMQRRFLPYFCTQFLGAFNDNIYKNALIIIITYTLLLENTAIYVNLAAGLFILPFLLFSSIAGQLADKLEKSGMMRIIKIAEIFIMLLGCFALYLQNVWLMLSVIFLLGAQSAFFGPIKYSILPQHLAEKELLGGNALVEAGTFLAILLGTIAGGFLASKQSYLPILMVTLLLMALLGWLCSLKIPKAEAAQPQLQVSYNIFTSSIDLIRSCLKNKPVFRSILAVSWFWFFSSLILTQFPVFTKTVLYGDAQVATLLLATFSIGIALGSMTCSYLSGGRVEIGLMPIGALGISAFTWHLGTVQTPITDQLRTIGELLSVSGSWVFLFDLTMIAFSSGMFIVPLYAFVQTRSDEHQRARIFAVNNIINSLFMVTAAALAAILLSNNFTVQQIFQIAAVLNIVVTIYILTVVPEYFLRLIGWLLIHSIYRIKDKNVQHIPERGGALMVCNHVSFIDPLILNAIAPRPIHFVMIENVYNIPVANQLFRWLKTVPISTTKKNPKLVEQAYDRIAELLEDDCLVCIFPEGSLTSDGEVADFKPGIENIVKRTPVPVIPVAMRGLWRTWFSRHRGSAMKGTPRAFMKRITVLSGPAVAPQDMTKELMRQKVMELRGEHQ